MSVILTGQPGLKYQAGVDAGRLNGLSSRVEQLKNIVGEVDFQTNYLDPNPNLNFLQLCR